MGNKFFSATEDLVAASLQTLRILRKHKDTESRLAYENLMLALRAMGVKISLKVLFKEEDHQDAT